MKKLPVKIIVTALIPLKINVNKLLIDFIISRVKSILVCKFLGYHFVVNHPA